MYTDLLKYLFIYFIIFSLYIESNPAITNVWFRTCSDGEKHFSIMGLVNVITAPLKIIELWYPCNWDINFIFGCIVIIGVFYYFNHTQSFVHKSSSTFCNNDKCHIRQVLLQQIV